MTLFPLVCVQLKRVSNQTAAGKKRTLSALVIVGNGNGVAGFGLGKAEEAFPAIRKVCLYFSSRFILTISVQAKNKAVNYLYFIPRYNDHTCEFCSSYTLQVISIALTIHHRQYFGDLHLNFSNYSNPYITWLQGLVYNQDSIVIYVEHIATTQQQHPTGS